MDNNGTEYEVFSFNRSRNILGWVKFLVGHVTWSPTLGKGCRSLAGLTIIYMFTKFEVSMFALQGYKGNAKCRNLVDLGTVGITEGHWQHNHSIDHKVFLFDFNKKNIRLPSDILYRFWVTISYL